MNPLTTSVQSLPSLSSVARSPQGRWTAPALACEAGALPCQRVGLGAIANVHLHSLVLDGVYVHEDSNPRSPLEFLELEAPTRDDIAEVAVRAQGLLYARGVCRVRTKRACEVSRAARPSRRLPRQRSHRSGRRRRGVALDHKQIRKTDANGALPTTRRRATAGSATSSSRSRLSRGASARSLAWARATPADTSGRSTRTPRSFDRLVVPGRRPRRAWALAGIARRRAVPRLSPCGKGEMVREDSRLALGVVQRRSLRPGMHFLLTADVTRAVLLRPAVLGTACGGRTPDPPQAYDATEASASSNATAEGLATAPFDHRHSKAVRRSQPPATVTPGSMRLNTALRVRGLRASSTAASGNTNSAEVSRHMQAQSSRPAATQGQRRSCARSAAKENERPISAPRPASAHTICAWIGWTAKIHSSPIRSRPKTSDSPLATCRMREALSVPSTSVTRERSTVRI